MVEENTDFEIWETSTGPRGTVRRVLYFVHPQQGTFRRWDNAGFESKEVPLKHHLIRVYTDAEDGNVLSIPSVVCGHAKFSWGMEFESIPEALDDETTSMDLLCKHCLNGLPEGVHDQITSLVH